MLHRIVNNLSLMPLLEPKNLQMLLTLLATLKNNLLMSNYILLCVVLLPTVGKHIILVNLLQFD